MDNQKSKVKKKPEFKRQDFLLKKLKRKWVRPRGLDSKLRLKRRGKGKLPKIGYGNDRKFKYLIKNQNYNYITNIKDLENTKLPIVISSKIGLKKKLEIINKAKELNLQILNIKDVGKFLENIKKKQEEKKEVKEKNKEKKIKKTEKLKEESKEEKGKKLKEEKRKVLEKGL